MYEPFAATTWSLAVVGDRHQLSVTSGTGAAACALATDHRNALGAAGHQMILNFGAATAGVACPQGSYELLMTCPNVLGSDASVTADCAYFRKWDAQGISLGTAASISGIISVAGSEGSCTIRANVGFVGGSFANMATLTNGTGAQPWCLEEI